MTLTPRDGTVFLVGESPEAVEKFMLARGCVHHRGGYRHPEKPNRFVFVGDCNRLRGLQAPLVYLIERYSARPDIREIEEIFVATKARLCLYPG